MEEFLALATETLSPVGHETLTLGGSDCVENPLNYYCFVTVGWIIRTRATKVSLAALAEFTFTTFGSVKGNNMVALAK